MQKQRINVHKGKVTRSSRSKSHKDRSTQVVLVHVGVVPACVTNYLAHAQVAEYSFVMQGPLGVFLG